MSDALIENGKPTLENTASKVADTEALHNFVRLLEQASPEERSLGEEHKGNWKIIISPKRQQPRVNSVGNIYVYRAKSAFDPNCSTDIYEVPNLHLTVGSFNARGNQYSQSLDRFASSLDPNEIEVDTTQVRFPSKRNQHWDTSWKENSTAGRVYSQEIYPRVLNAVLVNIQSLEQSPEGIQIVDLFGGDGEFVNLLYSNLPESFRATSTFHLIDGSTPSLEKARVTFANNHANIIVHEPRFIKPDEEIFQGIATPPKLVTTIGGLCGSIISRQEAMGICERIYKEMGEGGMLFVTGLSGVLLNSEDFQNIGFKVKQMAIPENVVYLKEPYQLYVLQK